MKQLHTFDEVKDSQKVFRRLLDAMANPGRVCEIGEQSAKLFGKNPNQLALAMTLLDGSVSFCAPGNPELEEQIVLLTHAKKKEAAEADYLFAAARDGLGELIGQVREGTLEDPHTSATLILSVESTAADACVELSGPGVDGTLSMKVPAEVLHAISLRDQQEYEFPKGTDDIFVLPGSRILCIPRMVKMREC